MAKRILRIPIRIVIYRENERWLAHCLELDLIGDGANQDEALAMLVNAIGTQIEASVKYDNPQTLFSPADAKYFTMYAAGSDVTMAAEINMAFETVVIEQGQARFYDDTPDTRLACV